MCTVVPVRKSHQPNSEHPNSTYNKIQHSFQYVRNSKIKAKSTHRETQTSKIRAHPVGRNRYIELMTILLGVILFSFSFSFFFFFARQRYCQGNNFRRGGIMTCRVTGWSLKKRKEKKRGVIKSNKSIDACRMWINIYIYIYRRGASLADNHMHQLILLTGSS